MHCTCMNWTSELYRITCTIIMIVNLCFSTLYMYMNITFFVLFLSFRRPYTPLKFTPSRCTQGNTEDVVSCKSFCFCFVITLLENVKSTCRTRAFNPLHVLLLSFSSCKVAASKAYMYLTQAWSLKNYSNLYFSWISWSCVWFLNT